MSNLLLVTRDMPKNILVCYFILLGGFRGGLEEIFSFLFLYIHDANDQACFNKFTAKHCQKKSYHVSVRLEICHNMGFPIYIFKTADRMRF